MAHRLGVCILNKPNKRNFIFKACVFALPMPKPRPSCCRKARVALEGARVLQTPVSEAQLRTQRPHFLAKTVIFGRQLLHALLPVHGVMNGVFLR